MCTFGAAVTLSSCCVHTKQRPRVLRTSMAVFTNVHSILNLHFTSKNRPRFVLICPASMDICSMVHQFTFHRYSLHIQFKIPFNYAHLIILFTSLLIELNLNVLLNKLFFSHRVSNLHIPSVVVLALAWEHCSSVRSVRSTQTAS